MRQKLKGLKEGMQAMSKASESERTEMKIAAANDLAERRALLIKQAEQLKGVTV